MKQLLLIVTLIGLVSVSSAWWCTGHMTVAYIAKGVMSKGAFDTVNSIAQALSAAGPFPLSPDFVQMACWADDLKSQNLESMEGWHFINQVYDPSNYPIPSHKWPIQEENVKTLIVQLEETIKTSSSNPAWDLQFALANLVHFYGDSHQPLHVVDLFSSTYPDGDYGGNLEVVYVDNTETRLHFIWDAICWEYSTDPTRPLSTAGYQVVVNFANYLEQTYTFTKEQKDEYNSTIFVTEGLQDAITYAYPGTYSGMTISPQYLATCKPIAEGRVALAGYRLGHEMEYLFGSGAKIDTPEQQAAMAKKIRERLVRHHVNARNFMHTHKDKIAGLKRQMKKK